jgi:hypothetical protein
VSRRYITENGDPLHTYYGLLVPTVSDARYAVIAAERIMSDCGFSASLRASRMNSPQQLYGTLNRAPSILYCADDYGSQLQFARRQPSGLLEQTMALLAGRIYNGSTITLDNWAEIGIKQPPGAPAQPVLHTPCVTLLAVIADAQMAHAFRRSELSRGALDSMIFVPAMHQDDWHDRPGGTIEAIPDAVRTVLRAARAFDPGQTEQTQAQVFSSIASIAPSPVVVHFACDVQGAERALLARFPRRAHFVRTMVDGARRNLRRVSATIAALARPSAPVVTEEILSWSLAFIGNSLEITLDWYEAMGNDDEKPDAYATIVNYILRQQTDGATERDLVRYVRAYRSITDRDKREQLLASLIEDEMIVAVASGRTTRYVHSTFVVKAPEVSTVDKVSTGGVDTKNR